MPTINRISSAERTSRYFASNVPFTNPLCAVMNGIYLCNSFPGIVASKLPGTSGERKSEDIARGSIPVHNTGRVPSHDRSMVDALSANRSQSSVATNFVPITRSQHKSICLTPQLTRKVEWCFVWIN